MLPLAGNDHAHQGARGYFISFEQLQSPLNLPLTSNYTSGNLNNQNFNAAVLLGGNLGNVADNLKRAKELIEGFSSIVQSSSIYRTEAWGMEGAPDFLNQVILLHTELKAHDLLRALLTIENKMHRQRGADDGVYLSRTIDLDILFYGELIVDSTELQIPHPRLHLRKFTLSPLVELIPDYTHPILKKTMVQLLDDCSDNSKVWKLES